MSDESDLGELLPCPFCGSVEALEENFLYEGISCIVCNANKGGCGGSSGGSYEADGAAKDWNRRVR